MSGSEISQASSFLSWAKTHLSPADLMPVLNPKWYVPPHLRYMSNELLRVMFDPAAPKRIMVLAPPRHAKSTLISLALPTWFLDTFPERNVILSSYEATFAYKWGGKVRDAIDLHKDYLRIRTRQDVAARQMWELAPKCADGAPGGGGMVTAGVGGPLTGHGAHLLIIDDPHKNWAEANSKTYQDKIWDWYTGTARDRLEPGAIVVLAMQRWCEADLAGRIQKAAEEDGEAWAVVRLPALAEDSDPLGRAPGEALWPERYDVASFEAVRRALGSYKFSAKFQQDPKPDEGQIFKRSRFRYFREANGNYELIGPDGVRSVPRDECWRFQTCDPAATTKETNDYFALLDVIVTPTNDLLFSGMLREHIQTTQHLATMRSAFERFAPAWQGVENKTFGLNIIQQLIEDGLPVRPLKADVDKVARARGLEARYEVGAVYHRTGAAFVEAFEDELLAFPNGAHDDQVDVAAYAANAIAQTEVGIDILLSEDD